MVTVIILTYNAGDEFLKLFDGLQKQTLKPDKILVIDSGSTDKTVESAINQNCEVIRIDHSKFDHGTTRNQAVAEVSDEFAIFLTQDAVPIDENMIAKLIEPMKKDENIAICYGRQIARLDAAPLECFARDFNYPEQSILKNNSNIDELGLKTFFCSNSCLAIRCSIFKKLGGFKDNVIVNEDMLFAAKAIAAGYSVYYSAEAKVRHSHPTSLSLIFRRYFNIGRFFSDNKQILKKASLSGYSISMLKSGIKIFWKKRKPHYIVALIVEFLVKAIACKLGWYYQIFSGKKNLARS
ncbi:MAG: glycosyltransferase [Sedimentisphaerales bacterium]|nr:glycosyltransferase [Sedimentisphaerales bacterium]